MTLALPVTARLLGSGGRTIGPRFATAVRSPPQWRDSAFACQARCSSLALAFGDGTGLRRHGVLPREPGRALAAVLLRARRRDRARALSHAGGRADRLRDGARLDAPDRRRDGPGAVERAAH